MYFKNMLVYRLQVPMAMTAEQLAEGMTKNPFQPCGGLERERRGWVPPVENGPLVHSVNRQWLVSLRSEKKTVPSGVVNKMTKQRAQELEKTQGFRPGRKQLKEIKEQVFDDLLPRAFPEEKTTYAWIDPVNGWLVVDAASASRAEGVIACLRDAATDFPLSPVNTELSPISAMAGWLASGEAPAGFTIDRDCELKLPSEDKSTVRYLRHPLEGDEVKNHLANGKLPTKLAMTYNDRLSFVFTENLEVKRLEFLDILKEEAEAQADTAPVGCFRRGSEGMKLTGI